MVPRPERRVCRNQRLSRQREMQYDVNQSGFMSYCCQSHVGIYIFFLLTCEVIVLCRFTTSECGITVRDKGEEKVEVDLDIYIYIRVQEE